MKFWRRTTLAVPCGFCRERIRVDAPQLVLEGPGWRKVRCATCAMNDGEQMPAEFHEESQDERRQRIEAATAAVHVRLTGAAQQDLLEAGE